MWYDKCEMYKRRLTTVWVLVALIMFVQAALPPFALAQVSVRCAGTPETSAPCMKAVLPIDGAAPRHMRCAQMSCCRNMTSLMRTCSMMNTPAASTSATSARTAFSSAKCLITITPISSPQAVFSAKAYRWMLRTVPSLAPPIGIAVASRTTFNGSDLHFRSTSFSPTLLVRLHGLRAPPVS